MMIIFFLITYNFYKKLRKTHQNIFSFSFLAIIFYALNRFKCHDHALLKAFQYELNWKNYIYLKFCPHAKILFLHTLASFFVFLIRDCVVDKILLDTSMSDISQED